MQRAAVAAIAAIVFALFGRWMMSAFVAAVGGTLVLLAALAPSAYRALDRLVLRASATVGRVLAYVLLAPVFFLVMTPLRALLRRGERARWRSGKEPHVQTHWRARPQRAPRLDRPF